MSVNEFISKMSSLTLDDNRSTLIVDMDLTIPEVVIKFHLNILINICKYIQYVQHYKVKRCNAWNDIQKEILERLIKMEKKINCNFEEALKSLINSIDSYSFDMLTITQRTINLIIIEKKLEVVNPIVVGTTKRRKHMYEHIYTMYNDKIGKYSELVEYKKNDDEVLNSIKIIQSLIEYVQNDHNKVDETIIKRYKIALDSFEKLLS